MRFALKAIPIGLLGCAAALLVACGDRSGLLSASAASSLQSALARVDSACASGQAAGAQRAVQSFHDQVAQLSSPSVDPRLIANLRQGAAALDTLVASTCTTPASTTPTTSTPTTSTTTTTPTTTTDTTTTPTTTTDTTTTPTTDTTPTTGGGGGTPAPDGGNGGDGNGNGNGPPGGTPPGQANGGAGGGQ